MDESSKKIKKEDFKKLKMKVIIRKIGSLINNLNEFFRSRLYIFKFSFFQIGIKIHKSVKFGKNVIIKVTDGAQLIIETNVTIQDNTTIIAKNGKIHISKNVLIGKGCVIVSREKIYIGENTLIAEYVVIRDQDHDLNDHKKFETSPIKIEKNCWIGSKATILKNSHINEKVVIGAHALVKGNIPKKVIAVGIPAKIKKTLN